MSTKLWSGRFEGEQDRLFDTFNRSLAVDSFLIHADIVGSKAHVAGLLAASILSESEASKLLETLEAIDFGLQSGTMAINPLSDEDEDVHMWLERQLTLRLGTLGKRVHTGRSRNDQVATAMKLWLKETLNNQSALVVRLAKTLLVLAETFAGVPMPGYTHLQPAQPITLGYHLLTYVAMLKRDLKKIDVLAESLDESPLGSGALAGTSYPIDREKTAALMGFACASWHAMDAISDRDYVVDYLQLVAVGLGHLSRLAEELIIWSTPRFNYVTLSDQWTSGSSMMPNKKNPDACELIRGKAGTAIGRVAGFMTTLKGLPLAYNKDLQEDKWVVRESALDFSACLVAMREQLATATFNEAAMAAALQEGYVNATDAADWLVNQGMTFREAHHFSGILVKRCIALGVGIEALPKAVVTSWLGEAFGALAESDTPQDMASDPSILRDFIEWVGIDACLQRRASPGGTAPEEVVRIIKRYQQVF